jgi:hypothetical protein
VSRARGIVGADVDGPCGSTGNVVSSSSGGSVKRSVSSGIEASSGVSGLWLELMVN